MVCARALGGGCGEVRVIATGIGRFYAGGTKRCFRAGGVGQRAD